jgi:hypothetical protein
MRMTRHDNLNACGAGLDIKLRQVVDHVDKHFAELNDFRCEAWWISRKQLFEQFRPALREYLVDSLQGDALRLLEIEAMIAWLQNQHRSLGRRSELN